MHRALVFVVLCGCASAAAPAPAPARAPAPAPALARAPAPAPAAAPAVASASASGEKLICIPKSAAPHPIAHVSVDGTSLVACFLLDDHEAPNTGYPCIRVEPKLRTFATAPSWWTGTGPKPAKAWDVRRTSSDVTVCKPGTEDCRTVKPGFTNPKGLGDPDSFLVADASPDGSKVFVIEIASAGQLFGDTFDVATGKRVAQVPLKGLSDRSDVLRVSWVGKRVQVSRHQCCGPFGSSELVEPMTGAAMSLGDPAMFVKAKGDRFLLGSESPTSAMISIVSTDDAKVLKQLPLPAKGFDEPELHVMDAVVLSDGSTAVVHANPPGVALVDVDTMTLEPSLAIPICTW